MQCELCGVQAATINKTPKSFGRGDTLAVMSRTSLLILPENSTAFARITLA